MIVVPFPLAPDQLMVARPSGPSPSPSLGIEAETSVGGVGTAHGVTVFEGSEASVPSPTEFTPR